MLGREGVAIGRRRVAAMMKRMGIAALYRRPSTSKAAPDNPRRIPHGTSIGRHIPALGFHIADPPVHRPHGDPLRWIRPQHRFELGLASSVLRRTTARSRPDLR